MIDWNDAFDNMGYIEGAAALPEAWARDAQIYRDKMRAAGRLHEDLAYGCGPRQRMDIITPEGASAGLVVFVHGGYWLKFDKSYWTHMAAGCVARGWSVAIPSYPLAPEARLSEMTASITKAVEAAAGEVPGPIRLTGHSAGGHLVSRMMCKGVLPEEIATRLAKVISISGLHQLAPLRLAKMNDMLGLTEDEAEAESAALQEPLADVPFIAWVGAQERPEFLRQARFIEEVWGRKGIDTSAVYDAGHHHFTVIEALRDPATALTNALLA